MKIIHTDEVQPHELRAWEREQVYNGLDCCVTAEILDVLLPQLDNYTAATYTFSRALQGPVLEMRLRGVRVDQARKEEVIEDFYETLEVLEENLKKIVGEGCGLWGFNWRSPADLRELFYDRLHLPVIRKQGKPTVNREALEKMEVYLICLPIVKHITAMRDLGKKIGVLRTEIDRDGRIRTSYNIAGTNTGRFSSSLSEFGTGTNLQNIEESLRSIFISDKGMKLAKFDTKQGESYCVGAIEWNLLGDAEYLDACTSGDLHTYVSRLCEPDFHWTGDLKHDKAIAERPYYRHHSLRKLCKSIGHGTNYGGKAKTLNSLYKIEIPIIVEFQGKYFKAFPAHQRWQSHVQRELIETGQLISLTGRKRQFWGRRDNHDVYREALAFDPQGSLADIVNKGMMQVWREGLATIYMHDHDAITVQYPEELEDEIVPKILKQLEVPIELSHGRTLRIPYDCKVGWNKGEFDAKTNPEGLKDYEPSDERKRPKEVSILDRPLRRAHR